MKIGQLSKIPRKISNNLKSNIENSILLPLSNFNPEQIKPFLEENKKIVIYCKSGIRSMQVCEIINDYYEDEIDIYNLEGGIIAWNQRL